MVVEIFITMALEIIIIMLLGIKIKIFKGQIVQTHIGTLMTKDLVEVKINFQQVYDPRLQLGVMDIGWMFRWLVNLDDPRPLRLGSPNLTNFLVGVCRSC